MILLADRNVGAKDLIADIAATGAEVLVRLKNGRVLRPHPRRGRTRGLRPPAHYQLLRTDRASFTTALHSARDLIIQAAAVIADTTIDLVGTIGRRVLTHLMPDRRLRDHTPTSLTTRPWV